MSDEELVAAVGSTIQRYIDGDIAPENNPPGHAVEHLQRHGTTATEQNSDRRWEEPGDMPRRHTWGALIVWCIGASLAARRLLGWSAGSQGDKVMSHDIGTG